MSCVGEKLSGTKTPADFLKSICGRPVCCVRGSTIHQFVIGDWVLLKLQAYKQRSVRGTHHKFEPKYFGPFQVADKIGQVAYKLNLPESAQIHNVFHVSQLRPSVPPTGPITDLPPVSHISDAIPLAVMDRRMVKHHNRAVAQWMIHWASRSPADASWEFAEEITICFPMFLADKEP